MINFFISWSIIINDAPRNGKVLRRVEYIEDKDAHDMDEHLCPQYLLKTFLFLGASLIMMLQEMEQFIMPRG